MDSSVTFLDLPIQGFVVGSAVGMFVAMINYRRTGDLDRWPLLVGYWALLGFAAGLLLALGRELT